MNDISHYHFFLGGHDAEMFEIKNILLEYGANIHDADLKWGAKISAYNDDLIRLLPHEIPVLIELEPDIPVLDKAVVIDHHGDLAGADKQTSIEQIAVLLNLKLTRNQQFISANDRGHIRGMLAIGATPEDIARVRAIDRTAQGITEVDYCFAEEAMENINEPFPGVALIESKTSRTAIIIDKLWNQYQTLIIKTPGEIHLSGSGKLIEALNKHYENVVKTKPEIKFWSGGFLPVYGFFGSTYYDIAEVLNLAKKETLPISQHVFLFPFRIERWDNKQHEEKQLKDVFLKLTTDIWDYKSFSPFKTPQCYNEYGYFHDYVRTALFGELDKKEDISEERLYNVKRLFNGHKPNFVSCLLERRAQKGCFELQIQGRNEPYKLSMDGVSLRLFETGIAILAIELFNHHYVDFNDIQRINDFGRRVYPQFLGEHNEHNPQNEIGAVKSSFLPESVRLIIDNNPIEEKFLLGTFMIPGHSHLHIGSHITKLMGDDFSDTYKIEPIIDDRMYTICWYRGDELLTCLSTEFTHENNATDHEYLFESSEKWYRFIFLDGNDCMCPDKLTRRALISASTYRRWNQYRGGSSLFGISRYSFVCLSGSDFIRTHMKRQYRLMAEILLAQRASIITFFRRIAEISRDIDHLEELNDKSNKDPIENISKRIRKLNADFLGFKNRLWFIEVTPQEQGIEMYDMAMKNMGLQKQMEELKDEIKELYDYEEMQCDKIRAEQMKNQSDEILKLTKLASFGVPFSIVFAIWGMSFEFITKSIELKLPLFIASILAALVVIYLIMPKRKEENQ